ncbi:MAG: hypothetical protein IJP70_01190 [Bacteroidales bacterium]|nr:hypothetical protein [Bacteroidales bacterium]
MDIDVCKRLVNIHICSLGLVLLFLLHADTNFWIQKSAGFAISLVRPATAPNIPWRSLRIKRILQWILGVLIKVSYEVAVRPENLSKYVFVSFPVSSTQSENTGTKHVAKVVKNSQTKKSFLKFLSFIHHFSLFFAQNGTKTLKITLQKVVNS